jgi:hypothetical protein
MSTAPGCGEVVGHSRPSAIGLGVCSSSLGAFGTYGNLSRRAVDFGNVPALGRGRCDQEEHRRYAVQHFWGNPSPMLKLLWGAMLFDDNAVSPDILRFLRKALKSKQQAKWLAEMLGLDFESLRKSA